MHTRFIVTFALPFVILFAACGDNTTGSVSSQDVTDSSTSDTGGDTSEPESLTHLYPGPCWIDSTWIHPTWIDPTLDEAPGPQSAYTYDLDGNQLTQIVECPLENDSRCRIWATQEWAIYDAKGNLVDILTDDAWGTSRQKFFFDVKNRPSYESFDALDDGTVNSQTWTVYDDAVRKMIVYTDNDGDDVFDRIVYHDLNADGDSIREEVDKDADGAIDSFRLHSYDTDGNLVRTESYVQGLLVNVAEFLYDEDGNQIARRYDSGGDGEFDFEQRSEYRNGFLIYVYEVPLTDLADGVLFFASYQRDKYGNLTEAQSGNNGVVDHEYIYHYGEYCIKDVPPDPFEPFDAVLPQ